MLSPWVYNALRQPWLYVSFLSSVDSKWPIGLQDHSPRWIVPFLSLFIRQQMTSWFTIQEQYKTRHLDGLYIFFISSSNSKWRHGLQYKTSTLTDCTFFLISSSDNKWRHGFQCKNIPFDGFVGLLAFYDFVYGLHNDDLVTIFLETVTGATFVISVGNEFLRFLAECLKIILSNK